MGKQTNHVSINPFQEEFIKVIKWQKCIVKDLSFSTLPMEKYVYIGIINKYQTYYYFVDINN